MYKKIALCALLVLVLVPASAFAAGMQGQAQGTGKGSGNSMQTQLQAAAGSTAGEQGNLGFGQGSGAMKRNGETLMLNLHGCNASCDQEQIRNMTRLQLGSGNGPATGEGSQRQCAAGENCTGVPQQNGQSNQQQHQSGEQYRMMYGLVTINGQNVLASSADQDRVMGRNQTRLHDGSCGACPAV